MRQRGGRRRQAEEALAKARERGCEAIREAKAVKQIARETLDEIAPEMADLLARDRDGTLFLWREGAE
jgi:hypothetical protein